MDEFLQRYPYKNKPFLHQEAYLTRFWEKRVAALFSEMGTGKSFMLINNMAMLYDQGQINAALIIAPKGVYRNWMDTEIPKHMPDHVVYRTVLWSASPKKAESQALENLFEITEDFKILIMNVEALSTEKGVRFASRYLLAHEAFMAIDESTTIKTHTAARAKNATKIGKQAKFKRIMTGSPVTKNPLDLFQQCVFLDPRCLGHDSFYTFQARYAVMQERHLATHSFKQILGFRHLEELREKLDRFSFRVTKEECLDLPDKLYTKREVDLTEEQAKAYKEMRLMALAMFKEGDVSTVNALTQIMRLHQIVCGHVKLDNGDVLELPSNRIKELLSIVEESDGKMIIWATYRHDIEAIKLALSSVYGMNSAAAYYGETETDKRQEIVNEFQDPNSPLRFFIGNPTTGGYGLTLTAANLVVYYSNSFDLEKRLQSEDRAHRIGQKNNVTYVDLYSPGTTDEMIFTALINKKSLADEVLNEKWRTWMK